MTFGPQHGAPGQSAPGAPPTGPSDGDREKLRQLRRRTDRIYGIGLLVVGIFATITNMTIFTENSLAQQFGALYGQYGVTAEYTRPEGLGTLSLVGIIGHPVIYAVALYLTLIAWKHKKIGFWIPIVGAVAAFAFSTVLLMVGISMHPELFAAAMTPPTPTP